MKFLPSGSKCLGEFVSLLGIKSTVFRQHLSSWENMTLSNFIYLCRIVKKKWFNEKSAYVEGHIFFSPPLSVIQCAFALP